jgi:hypothetical protein
MSRDLFDLMGGDDADTSRNGELPAQHDKVELEMVLHYDTGKAVQVSDTGEEARAVWLRKSQIQMNASGKKVPSVKKDGQRVVLPVVTINIPEWLAKNKGLI